MPIAFHGTYWLLRALEKTPIWIKGPFFGFLGYAAFVPYQYRPKALRFFETNQDENVKPVPAKEKLEGNVQIFERLEKMKQEGAKVDGDWDANDSTKVSVWVDGRPASSESVKRVAPPRQKVDVYEDSTVFTKK